MKKICDNIKKQILRDKTGVIPRWRDTYLMEFCGPDKNNNPTMLSGALESPIRHETRQLKLWEGGWRYADQLPGST